MFSRPLKIAIAVGSVVGLLVAVVAVNARQSWRPVSVDFGVASGSFGPQPLPIVWRGNDLWLLAGRAGTVSYSATVAPTVWRKTRNWNRTSVPIIQPALFANDVVAVSLTDTSVVLSDGTDSDRELQIWQGRKLRRHLRDVGYLYTSGLRNARRPQIFSFSPDGMRLVAESELYGYDEDAEVEPGFCVLGLALFDVRTGKQIVRQSAREGGFTDFAWSPDATQVAGITADGWVFVLDGQSGKLRLKFRAHQFFGAQIAWSPDGKTLVTATNPCLVLSQTGVKLAYRSQTRALRSPSGTITQTVGQNKWVVASDANGDTTWNGRTERSLKRFDARTGKQIGSTLSLKTGAVDLAFSPNGRQLAVGEHEFALILDAQTLATERRIDIPAPPAPLWACFWASAIGSF